jgi:PAS domain S-box-containing protein
MEKRFLHKSGRVVWGMMTATLIRTEAGEPLYTLAIIEDSSERKARRSPCASPKNACA